MQNSIYIALILALTSCSNGGSNDLERMKLNGKIKSILEEKHDRNGEPIMSKETYFTTSGQVKLITYHYQEPKNLIKSINHYDFWGRLTKQEFFANDSLMLSQKYLKINPKKDSLVSYNSNGNLINVAVLEYNNDRQVIESKLFDLNNKLIRSETYTYDFTNLLRETRIKSIDSSTNGEVYKYSYDSYGRILTFTETNSFSKFESIEKYRYETDEMNNWIKKQILTTKDEVIAIVTRKIEYN